MATHNGEKAMMSNSEKIRRSVRALMIMPFEGRLRLFVRAGLMSEAEAKEKLAEKASR